MPGFRQRGPKVMGLMTGWGRGLCNSEQPVYRPDVAGNTGFGHGTGLARGFRCGFRPQMNVCPARGMGRRGRGPYGRAYPEDAQVELDRLKNETANMQNALEAINARITELEKSE